MKIDSDYADGLALYEAMQTICSFERRMAVLQAQGMAPGTCTAVGQAAAAVGVMAATRIVA